MKSIANQYRDLKEGKMSQQNFMRNLRMTMPQFVTNVTSFGDAVKILKNKSIIVETPVKEYIHPYYGDMMAVSTMVKQKIDSVLSLNTNEELNVFIKPIKFMLDQAFAEDIDIETIEYEATKEMEFQLEMIEMSNNKNNYKELRSIFAKIKAIFLNAIAGFMAEGKENEELEAMIKKIEDEKTGEEAVKSQYDENKDKEFDEEEDEEEMYDAEYDEDEMFNPAYMNEAKTPDVERDEDENLEEVTLGIFMEHADFPEKSYEETAKIVKKNIKKNPNYYTNYKLTGIRDYKVETMDTSKPEDHQMKFYTEKTAVDTARGMQKVKMPKKEEKKKLKENKIKTDIKGQIVQATNNDGVTFSKNDDAKAIDNGEKIKIAGFKEEQGKVKALFSKGMFFSAIDIDGLEKVVSASPIAQALTKKSLEEIIHETISEYFDGRDNLINPLSAKDENN